MTALTRRSWPEGEGEGEGEGQEGRPQSKQRSE